MKTISSRIATSETCEYKRGTTFAFIMWWDGYLWPPCMLLTCRTVTNTRLAYISRQAFQSNPKLQYLWVLWFRRSWINIKCIIKVFSMFYYMLLSTLIVVFFYRNLKENNLSNLSWRTFRNLNISYLWVSFIEDILQYVVIFGLLWKTMNAENDVFAQYTIKHLFDIKCIQK